MNATGRAYYLGKGSKCRRNGKLCVHASRTGCDYMINTNVSKLSLKRAGTVKSISPPDCELFDAMEGKSREAFLDAVRRRSLFMDY